MKGLIIKRLIGFFIDAFCIFFITILTLFIIDFFKEDAQIKHVVLQLGISFIYYLLFETLLGRTIGKYVVGTKVIFSNENKFKSTLIRTLLRVIPLEPLSIFFRGDKMMWHDIYSQTKVVDLYPPDQLHLA